MAGIVNKMLLEMSVALCTHCSMHATVNGFAWIAAGFKIPAHL